jgi:hypothetical protein
MYWDWSSLCSGTRCYWCCVISLCWHLQKGLPSADCTTAVPTHRLQGGLRREGGLDTSQAVLAVSGGYVWALNPFWFSIDWFLILIGGYPMVGGGNTSLDQPRSSLLVYVHVLHISIINLLFYRAIALLSDSTPSKPYRTRHIYVSYKYWFIISPDLRKHQGVHK